ncbi:hypothetical protein MRB53_001793 [Persea americana]|uniref:Uncharacterized protein n=1 Tax=Persea americana TaxID=3435 RepID=A0ACC2MTM7_PERAE|nr:hypothetical protein MRB53_001793 [Persea americana]
MLLSCINATLSTSALPYVVGIKSAKEAWDALALRYASITSSHVMTLRKQLHRIKKGTTSMADYLQQFKVITDQLAASASPINEDELLYAILDGLPLPTVLFNLSFGLVHVLVPCPLKKFTTSSYVRSLVLQMILRKIPLLQHLLPLNLLLSSLLDLALMVVV